MILMEGAEDCLAADHIINSGCRGLLLWPFLMVLEVVYTINVILPVERVNKL